MSDNNQINWKTCPLSTKCKLSGGYGFPDKLQGALTSELPFIKVSDMNLDGNEKYVVHSKNFVTLQLAEKMRWSPFPSKTVVFAKVGAALKLNRRRILSKPTLIDNNMMAAEALPGLDAIFLYHFLATVDFGDFVQDGALPSINQNQVGCLTIPELELAEQRAIASILDTMDEAISRTEAVIAKLRQVKAGMRHDLLTRGLDENGELRDPIRHPEQFKDSPLGKVPATWEICPLIAFATLQRGFDIIVADQIAGNIPVVSSSGITSYHNEAAVKGPGVVIGRKGKLGEAYFLGGPFWPHDTSLWVKNFHGNDERFTALFLKFLRLERFDAATSVPTLNRNVIHPLLVSIPPKSEQIEIVTHLEEHEAFIQKEALILNKLRTIKKGLMHDLLTGTVRIPPQLLEAAP